MRTKPMNYIHNKERFVEEEEDYDDVSSTAAVMSVPETGSPNASKSKMRPEPFQWSKGANEEDDESTISYFGVEVKKRSSTKDRNPGATKKSKANWVGKQIAAALDDGKSSRREDLYLSMRADDLYARIMEDKFKLLDSCTNLRDLGRSILQQLRKDYDLYDTNGQAVGDVAALKKIIQCLQNKRRYTKQSDQKSQQSKPLPKICLSMKQDKRFANFMSNVFKKMERNETDSVTFEQLGDEALNDLTSKYRVVDKNGCAIQEKDALKKLVQCLKNRYHRHVKSDKQIQPSSVAVSPIATTPGHSRPSRSDIILDMRFEKVYRDKVKKFFNDYVNKKYNDISETADAVMVELQKSLGTDGKFIRRVKNHHLEVDNETALQLITTCLNRLDEKRVHEDVSDNEDMVQIEQAITRENLTEKKRLDLLDYFGRSIIVNFLKQNTSCGWKFSLKQGLTDEWIALAEGYTRHNSEEDVTKLTGLRKIAHWAYRNGHFDAYAKDPFGLNMLERQGLSAESYHIIFDKVELADGHESTGELNPNAASAGAAAGAAVVEAVATEDEATGDRATLIDIGETDNRESDNGAKDDDGPFAGNKRFRQTADKIQSSLSSAEEKGDELSINFFGHLDEWLVHKSCDSKFIMQFQSQDIDEAVQEFDSLMNQRETAEPRRVKFYENQINALVCQAKEIFNLN